MKLIVVKVHEMKKLFFILMYILFNLVFLVPVFSSDIQENELESRSASELIELVNEAKVSVEISLAAFDGQVVPVITLQRALAEAEQRGVGIKILHGGVKQGDDWKAFVADLLIFGHTDADMQVIFDTAKANHVFAVFDNNYIITTPQDRDLEESAESVSLPKVLFTERQRLPLIFNRNDTTAFAVYLYLLNKSFTLQEKQLLVNIDDISFIMGIPEETVLSEKSKNVNRILKRIETRYELIELSYLEQGDLNVNIVDFAGEVFPVNAFWLTEEYLKGEEFKNVYYRFLEVLLESEKKTFDDYSFKAFQRRFNIEKITQDEY